MRTANTILVTGAPRSGTTWVGSVLGLPRHVGVIFEPFHPDAGVFGISGERLAPGGETFRVEFPYIENGHPFAADFNRLFRDVLAGRAPYKQLSAPGRHGWFTTWARALFTSRVALQNRLTVLSPFHRRFIVKDPHLCLAAEYLHHDMGIPCLVIVRHPAATVESRVRLGWIPDVRQFWQQPALRERYLKGLLPPNPADLSPVKQATWGWVWIHKVLLDLRQRNPDMVFVRLEDLARDPVPAFRTLYERFGLPFDRRVERIIRTQTETETGALGTSDRPHQLWRDSRTVLDGWKSRLSPADQLAVRHIAGETAAAFYADDTWDTPQS